MNLIYLLNIFKKHIKVIIFSILLSWLTIMMGIGLMSLSGWFISYSGYLSIGTYTIAASFNYFYPSAGIRFFSLIRILSRYIEKILIHETTFRIITDIRIWLYKKLESITPTYFLKYKYGDLLTTFINDANILDHLFIRIILPTIVFILSTIIIMLIFCFINFNLAILTFLSLNILGLIIPLMISFISIKKTKKLNKINTIMKTNILEYINHLTEIKIFDPDNNYLKNIKQKNIELLKQEKNISIISGFNYALITTLLGLINIMTIFLSIKLVNNKTINGAFIAFIFFTIIAISELMISLPLAYQYLGKVFYALNRIFNIMNIKENITYPKNSSIKLNNYNINFNKINFKYNFSQPILNNFSLNIKENEKIAIFAPNGKGKSTIINLLIRFWDVDTGTITIGNKNIKTFSEYQLRNFMTVINQSPYIFNTSIKENLIIANNQASDYDLFKALEKVKLKKYVESLPNKLNEWTGELGKLLSGGQKKCLALARAFLQNKPILILDEPTEGLDKETEKLIFKNIIKLMNKKTVIFITHNIKFLKKFDRIINL